MFNGLWATCLLLLLVLLVVGRLPSKGPRLRRFKSDRDEIWQETDFRLDVTLSR